MKVKLFTKMNPLGSRGKKGLDFENEINAWLEQNPAIKVIDIKQSACGGSFGNAQFLITVWYEENG